MKSNHQAAHSMLHSLAVQESPLGNITLLHLCPPLFQQNLLTVRGNTSEASLYCMGYCKPFAAACQENFVIFLPQTFIYISRAVHFCQKISGICPKTGKEAAFGRPSDFNPSEGERTPHPRYSQFRRGCPLTSGPPADGIRSRQNRSCE